jgi:hypothetical protein
VLQALAAHRAAAAHHDRRALAGPAGGLALAVRVDEQDVPPPAARRELLDELPQVLATLQT